MVQEKQQSKEPPGTRSFGRALLWPLAAVGLGLLLIHNSVGTPSDAKPLAGPVIAAPASPPPAAATARAHGAGTTLPRAEPTRLIIRSIAVDAPFMPLSIGASGRLDSPPPNDNNLVGWFREGVTPGEPGAAIVAGHLDTKSGPGVFLYLGSVRPGTLVDVVRGDGSVVTFAVDSVESFSKENFPDDRVYKDTPDPQLRLITCGGEYDKKAKDYKENVVVFAHMVVARQG
ncbi:class F sortase [Streptomyces sp. NPDC048389]|uniref:class F sortase n=1 Tax=Streptomyces sp. NPDC048389 TaxID=3154622 RepID=UPI0034563928